MIREHHTGSILRDIVRRINGADGITIDQHQQNAMYGTHQVRVRLAGDERPYRLILALGDVPYRTPNGIPIDEHFADPIHKDFA